MSEEHYDDYHKWLRWAYEQRYGKGSWSEDKDIVESEKQGFHEYKDPFRTYWSEELSVGILERDGRFIGVACLVAKEIVDREKFVRRFGLSFEKDVRWKSASSLLDYLSRSPLFKAVLVTLNKIPFKLEPDVPEKLKERLDWAERNYEYHKDKAEAFKLQIEQQSGTFGIFPKALPSRLKEEQAQARYFLEETKSLERRLQEHLKQYFLIKEKLFAVALFFYIYTTIKRSLSRLLMKFLLGENLQR